MQKGINFIPLEAIVGRVVDTLPKEAVAEDRILEWAYEAYEGIITNDVYEQHVDVLQVVNHKAQIPTGFFSLNMVLYKSLCYTASDGTVTCSDFPTSSTNTSSITTTTTSSEVLNEGDTTTTVTTTEVSTTPGKNITTPIYVGDTENGSLTEQQLKGYTQNTGFMEWRPLPMTSNVFHNGALLSVKNVLPANVTKGCVDSFNIQSGCIITTFEKGLLAVSYNGIPKDDNGDARIPDLEYVKIALETYCLMRFWQWRFNMMQDGAQQRYRLYKQEWQLLAPKASGQLLMPTFVEYQNLRNVNKFIKEDSPFANAMGSGGNSEVMRFDNQRFNSFTSF